MNKFNDIGISKNLDWDRIAHLFKIGIVAALMGLAGDLVLGWGHEPYLCPPLPKIQRCS